MLFSSVGVMARYRGTTRWSSSSEIVPASTLARPSVQSERHAGGVAAALDLVVRCAGGDQRAQLRRRW